MNSSAHQCAQDLDEQEQHELKMDPGGTAPTISAPALVLLPTASPTLIFASSEDDTEDEKDEEDWDVEIPISPIFRHKQPRKSRPADGLMCWRRQFKEKQALENLIEMITQNFLNHKMLDLVVEPIAIWELVEGVEEYMKEFYKDCLESAALHGNREDDEWEELDDELESDVIVNVKDIRLVRALRGIR